MGLNPLMALVAFAAIHFLIPAASHSLNSDGLALLALKSAITTDPSDTLKTWSASHRNPCRWVGVTCSDYRVTELTLPSLGLTGYIPSELGLLHSLQRLTLRNNTFSKTIPARLFNATSLTHIDLSRNHLAGPVPSQINSLKCLTQLDLSSNHLNGSLPQSLSDLSLLAGTVNLSYNDFSGEIPPSYGAFPVKVSLDLRHNNLTGRIPQTGSLLNQGPTAFSGNPRLCGFPLQTPCPEAGPENPLSVPNPKLPNGADIAAEAGEDPEQRKQGTVTVAIPIISGVSVLIAAVTVSVWIFNKKRSSSDGGRIGKPVPNKEDLENVKADEQGHKGKFVVLDEGFDLELEDLLRASAYVVGKSKGGIVYKVVCGGGAVVAVRRLSESDAVWKFKEFVAAVEAIGRVQHPNLVRLRAYYYASDEKLLVSDFINNGSLYTALHGGPSSPVPPLSWASRLKIAQGIARGLMHVHENSPRRYVHSNVKSSKILLGNDLHPYISGFGMTHLISGASELSHTTLKHQNLSHHILKGLKVSGASVVYSAPEIRFSGSKFTQKCDVYSFGIVLLEILTGKMPDGGPEDNGDELESFVRKAFREKCPMSDIIDPSLLHEVYAKKQVVAAFHIALNCTEVDPEVRPRMRYVSESLDRINLQ
uniref:Protein kinase domain-containing protein n=1 Tax=Kalanchoe fedtschenkoi TaxID=63787 RepID=A0A7N0UU58_KALFE